MNRERKMNTVYYINNNDDDNDDDDDDDDNFSFLFCSIISSLSQSMSSTFSLFYLHPTVGQQANSCVVLSCCWFKPQ